MDERQDDGPAGAWRFVTWNLDWHRKSPEQVPRTTLLGALRPSVVALQEVAGHVAKELRDSHDGPAVFSQEMHADATWRWMGCGLLLPAGSVVLERGVIDRLPKPQRCVWVRAELPHRGLITLVSWHAPNAAGDGVADKMRAFEAMTEWLAQAPRPMVLGADLNTWTDPVDLRAADPADPFTQEHAFVGPDPDHGLVDVYRTVLQRTGELDRLRATLPDGPLSASHRLNSGAEHRMDRIYASPDLIALAAGYETIEAAKASGSDHAPHWADLARPGHEGLSSL